MTKEWKDGYNFAIKEIEHFLYFLNGDSTEAVSFRVNNGSKGVIEEIISYLEDRERI